MFKNNIKNKVSSSRNERTNVKKSNPQDELKQRHKSFVGSLTKKAPVKKYKKNFFYSSYIQC